MRYLKALAVCGMIVAAGCSSTPSPRDGVRADQEAALRDPMGYKPEMDRRDLSGGGLGNFDKDEFKKDWKSVFDP